MKRLIIYLLIFIFAISLAYAIPGSWYGYVSLDSSNASDGVIVDAYIGNSIVGTTSVGAVQSGGYYLVHVEGSAGDNVSFKIYGNNVSENAQTWSMGFHHPELNLTASSTANGGACPTYSAYTSGTNVVNNGCSGGYCVHGVCRISSVYCGDGYCDTGEICSSDTSACSSGYACTNGCQSTGTITTTTSGGGGGGAAVTTARTYTVTLSTEEAKQTVRKGDKIEFTYKGAAHTITVESVDDNEATITIASIPSRVTLSVGESTDIDLDDNGYNDLKIKLLSITRGYAKFSLTEIAGVIPEVAPVVEEKPAPVIEEIPVPVEELPPTPPSLPPVEEIPVPVEEVLPVEEVPVAEEPVVPLGTGLLVLILLAEITILIILHVRRKRMI